MNVNRIVKSMTVSVIVLVTLIGVGGFILSYGALHAIGIENGMPSDWRGYIWPLLTDFGLIVFTLALLTAQVTQQRVWLWTVGVTFLALASMAYNVAHAELAEKTVYQIVLTVAVTVWPPLMLVLTTEALRHLLKTVIDRAGMVVTMTTLSSQKQSLENELSKLRRSQTELRERIERQQNEQAQEFDRHAVVIDRRESILADLKTGSIGIAELARKYNISEATARRDVNALNGKVK